LLSAIARATVAAERVHAFTCPAGAPEPALGGDPSRRPSPPPRRKAAPRTARMGVGFGLQKQIGCLTTRWYRSNGRNYLLHQYGV